MPGGTTLIEGERAREGAVYDVTDALSYAPGIYVGTGQGLAGGEARISSRGSDIKSSISPIVGMKVLRDGLPLTNANGATDVEQINFWPVQFAEIYRGANALVYGGSNLGGAINLVSQTGYTADRLRGRMISGSDGFINPSVSAGAVLGNGWDGYGAFSYLTSDGFRPNSDVERVLGYGNMGYRWNESNETRLHFDLQDHEFFFAGSLTKAQIEEDPVKNTPKRERAENGFPVYRVDLHHTLTSGNRHRVDLGAYYQEKDFTFGGVQQFRDLWDDAGFALRHEYRSKLWGRENRLLSGGLFQWLWIDDRNFGSLGNQRGPLTLFEKDDVFNMEIFVEDQLDITESLKLVLGAQWAYRNNETEKLFPAVPGGTDNTAELDSFSFNPKAGFIWNATDQIQVFGNVSRSSQPIDPINFADFFQDPPLREQTATTVEIGTRGETPLLRWDVAFYHAWVEDELLLIPIPPRFVDFISGNADRTLHTGLELGVETDLPVGWLNPQDQVRLRGTYTWNHFRFDDDPTFGDNHLPAIPEHIGRFEMLYQHPSGFSIGPNMEAASSNFVDFANTLKADSYVLLGARASYEVSKTLRLFVDGRNLTNEFYAASVFVTADAGGVDDALFNPGLTRSVFGGVELRW
ncbi:MAG: TonB-dependent receptor family protein [Beijerinckiaceae bacterium]